VIGSGEALLKVVWHPKHDADAEPLRTCTIVTTSANATMRPVHDRMPVVLPRAGWDRWLDPSRRKAADVVDLLVPAPDDLLVRRPVSTKVNNVKNEGAELLNSA